MELLDQTIVNEYIDYDQTKEKIIKLIIVYL